MNEVMMWVKLSNMRSKRVKKEYNLYQEMLWNGTYDADLKAIIDDNWDTDNDIDQKMGFNKI